MKLLLDENLPPKLAARLDPLFPGTRHVSDVALAAGTDSEVWEYARVHGFAITSKDSDFHQRSFVFGAPPKVIWLRIGNCSTRELEALLLARVPDILAFEADTAAAFLVLSP